MTMINWLRHGVVAGLACWLAAGAAADVPDAFRGLLKEAEMTKAEAIVVVPPKEIDKFVAKVEEAAVKDPEWFAQYSRDAPPGVPLPFHEKLGLTKEEYQEYLAVWDKREFRVIDQMVLQLKQSSSGEWTINATGNASVLATLRYLADKDVFDSPNGTLERIEDIDANELSILGAWTGREWRFLEETGLGMTKENIALGQTADKKHGLVVYRVQEISSLGTRLYDRSMVIRFRLGAAAVKKP